MFIEWILETDMSVRYLALAALVLLVWRTGTAVMRSRERRRRDFQRKLETVLLPKETVTAVCPQKNGRWILTSKRLLTETRQGFTALDLKDIRSAQGITAEGKRTTVPEKMASLIIKADTEHRLTNTGTDFEDLARQLLAILKKRREKKK